jgi:tetratricopeptide (TPR) repeat protein
MGTQLGRYLLIGELGRGGVGVVYRAYDPKLQREVAIKCVRPEVTHPERQARLVREAQAMARLSHANVVSVYDVEQDGDTAIIAMEHVDGTSLARWLAARPRPWREIVAKFIDAGRGLQAAHDVGMLHRDFKPGNVLIGADGRARVSDFGLARTDDTARISGSVAEIERASDVEIELDLDTVAAPRSEGRSDASATMGTPAYMAPEQHLAGVLGPAVDQYAFCVSLWQALVGELPFGGVRGRGLRALIRRKRAGPPPWPKHIDVPRRLADAVCRGLAVDPRDRWPSMQALLGALRLDPGRNRRLATTALAITAVVGTSAVAIAWRRERARACSGASAHLDGIWDAARRDQVEQAMRATGVTYADALWTRVAPILDGYADDWTAMHTQSCEATALLEEQSTEVLDLRMVCLHHAKVELAATTGALASADGRTMERAHELVAALPVLDRCADVEALRAEVRPPETAAAAAMVRALEAELAAGRTQLALGNYDAALAITRRIAPDVAGLDYDPILTEWSLLEGEALRADGAFAEAGRALSVALRSGLRARQWGEALRAAQELTYLVGSRLKRHDEAMAFGELALGLSAGLGDAREAATHDSIGAVRESQGKFVDAELEYRTAFALWQSAPEPDALAMAQAHSNVGSALNGQARYDEGEAEQREGLALRIRALGPDHPDVARAHVNVGNSLYGRGRYREAEAEYRIALAIGLRALGPDHPDVGASHNNLGNALVQVGEFEAAAAELRTAIAIRERVFGPEHASVAQSHNNLGNALMFAGDLAGAEAEFRLGLEGRAHALGPDHPDVAASHHSLGNVLSQQGKDEEAAGEYELALTLRRRALGADHPDVTASRFGRANALYNRRAYVEAEAEYAAVLAAWEQSLGPDHPDVATARYSLANARYYQGRWALAEVDYRRALALREVALGGEHPNIAASAFGLALTLEALGRDAEAVPLYERAIAILRTGPAGSNPTAPGFDLAESELGLARVLWSTPQQRNRSRALAVAACDGFAKSGDELAARECNQWRASHR